MLKIRVIPIYLLLSSALSTAFAFELENNQIEELSNFVDRHLEVSSMTNHEKEVLAQINNTKKDLDTVYANLIKSNHPDSPEFNYLQNYAILTAVYAEYLMKIDCKNTSKYYQNEAEQTYLKLQKLKNNDRYLLYNLAIFYARTSTFYRKNQNTEERYKLLKQAEKILLPLSLKYPSYRQYRIDYYAVMSDQLDVLQKRSDTLSEQKKNITIVQKPLFALLKNNHEEYDTGNFIILIQQYYKYLYAQNPKQADQWLITNQKSIENLVKNKKSNDLQREYEFMAEFYALLNHPDQALYYLNKIDVKNADAPEPKSLEFERNFANLKLNKEFQAWLAQYKIQYQKNVDLYPKVCKSIQKSQPIEINKNLI